jgi:hypothetical protein
MNVCSWASGSVELPAELEDELEDELDGSDEATLGLIMLVGAIIRCTPGSSGGPSQGLQPGRLFGVLPAPLLGLLLAGETPAIAGASSGLAGRVVSGVGIGCRAARSRARRRLPGIRPVSAAGEAGDQIAEVLA